MNVFALLLVLFVLASPAYAIPGECVLAVNDNDSIEQLIQRSIARQCGVIVVPEGEWRFGQSLLLDQQTGPFVIRGSGAATVLTGQPRLITIRRSANISFENLTIEGIVELEQTEDIRFSGMTFRRGGIHLPGKKCNQPNECTIFNRRIVVEDCTFENCERGIHAERLENSRIEQNRFIGSRSTCATETIGIELDGSSEDLDRALELGHSKGNHIIQNSFEQEGTTGVRIRDSWGNIIRDNTFVRAYRAMELLEGARHNQILQSYITYLSQQPISAACLSSCAIYLAPGSVNNVFWNNFFEQSFELQFLESNRNRTYVIDESGQQNVFRSDFLRINR